jgi:Domain of unknown function (DUF4115)
LSTGNWSIVLWGNTGLTAKPGRGGPEARGPGEPDASGEAYLIVAKGTFPFPPGEGEDKIFGVGRHVSDRRRRALQRSIGLAVAGMALLVGLVAFGVYGIVTNGHDSQSTARSDVTATARPSPLVVTVTGAHCRIFIRVPAGDILFNDYLAHGQTIRFDEPRLDVVVADAGAVKVYVNGRARPLGGPGQRAEFTVFSNP